MFTRKEEYFKIEFESDNFVQKANKEEFLDDIELFLCGEDPVPLSLEAQQNLVKLLLEEGKKPNQALIDLMNAEPFYSKIDKERMEKALKSPTIDAPPNMTHEERRDFIKNSFKK